MIKKSPLTPQDHILWILTNHGSMERSKLRKLTKLRLADMDLAIGELVREGRIRISGDMVSLR